jgi:hypothetical protein
MQKAKEGKEGSLICGNAEIGKEKCTLRHTVIAHCKSRQGLRCNDMNFTRAPFKKSMHR